MRRASATPAWRGGFSLVEFIVVLVVVSIIAAILLDRVRFYQERAEKAAMEATAAAIRAGLHLRMAGYLVAGRGEQDLAGLASANPMDWMAKKPVTYAGAFDRIGAEEVPEGSWYFDLGEHVLVYKIRYSQGFVPDAHGRKEVRFRVVLDYGPLNDPGMPGIKGIRTVDFSPVVPYTWDIDG